MGDNIKQRILGKKELPVQARSCCKTQRLSDTLARPRTFTAYSALGVQESITVQSTGLKKVITAWCWDHLGIRTLHQVLVKHSPDVGIFAPRLFLVANQRASGAPLRRLNQQACYTPTMSELSENDLQRLRPAVDQELSDPREHQIMTKGPPLRSNAEMARRLHDSKFRLLICINSPSIKSQPAHRPRDMLVSFESIHECYLLRNRGKAGGKF